MGKKQEIPPMSIRIPVKYRILLRRLAMRNKTSDAKILVLLLENEKLRSMGNDGERYFDSKFTPEGFCKSECTVDGKPLGACLLKGQVKLDNSRRYCVEKCNIV